MSDLALPELTVIVAALNEERTIDEVVRRLLALPLRTQIIVVDDGSTDRTGWILASFGDRSSMRRRRGRARASWMR